MAYVPPYPTRPARRRDRENDGTFHLGGGWTALRPVGRLMAWPVAIILGWPSAFGFLGCLFAAALFFATGHVPAALHALTGAVACGVMVTMAFAPLNALRR